jgi:hypothetical protein
MKGWQIFVHSLRLVLNNIRPALQVSALLYLPQVLLQVMSYRNPQLAGPGPMAEPGAGPADPGLYGTYLLLGLLSLVASLWIAVAWHRYVLEEEYPRGYLPRWHGASMLGYLGRSILLGLIVLFAMAIAGIPVGLVGAAAPGLVGVLVFGLIGLAGYLFFRLGVMLPAAAIGERMSLSEAWSATRDDDGAVVVLALLVIGGSVIVQLPSLVGGQGSFVDLVYQVVTGWFATLIGISVLTTLYGHYVQGRPID